MTYILLFFNIIANIILYPFFLLYALFDALYNNKDEAKNIGVIILAVGWAIVFIILKNPTRYGWFSFVMSWVIAFIISLAVYTAAQWALIGILKIIFMIPADIYVSNHERIERYQQQLSDKKYASEEKTIGGIYTKREIKQQADAEVSLNYFIDKDEKIKVPYIRYIKE